MVSREFLPVAKPMELIAAREAFESLFSALQDWFEVPGLIEVDVSAIDAEAALLQLRNPVMVAGMAMRKLQALHHLAAPTVVTSVDVVLSLIDGVLQALAEAPGSYLKREASLCDWDHELHKLDQGLIWKDPHRTDGQVAQFEQWVQTLLELRSILIDMGQRGVFLLR
jgi:hypothetical protein